MSLEMAQMCNGPCAWFTLCCNHLKILSKCIFELVFVNEVQWDNSGYA